MKERVFKDILLSLMILGLHMQQIEGKLKE